MAMTSTTTEPVQERVALRKVLAAGGLGTLIEYLDYASYSYLATTLAVVFFPSADHNVALLNTFAIFALSFVMRPLGAIFWGTLGDRLGRKRVLATTILLMSGSTFLIGLIPSYAAIGLAAPALLLLLRIVQSFSAAGEYAGAGIYIAEFAPARNRGFLTGAVPMAASGGFLLASLMSTVLYSSLSTDSMESWGWRIPFLVAGPLGAIGLYLRYRLEETPLFRAAAEAQAQKTIRTIAEDSTTRATGRRQDVLSMFRMLMVMALNAGGYYLLLGYVPTFLVEEAGMSQAQSSTVVTISLVIYTLMIPFSAALSDRIGRRRSLLIACVGLLIIAYPVMMGLSLGGVALATVILVATLAVFSLNDAVFPAFFAESFETRSRYLGFALPFNVGAVAFGGVAPYVASWLIDRTGNPHSAAFFLMGVATLSIVGVALSRETARQTLPAGEA
jgi:MHS family proline/betaine transporter-like MFS transporter